MKIFAAVVAILLPLCAIAADYQLAPRKIAPDTYVIEGLNEDFSFANGGNIVNTAFIVTDAGVVVIDSGPSKRYGEQLHKAIATVTDQPVTVVYITHLHPDHFLGNQAFAEADIRALAGTIEGIKLQGDDFASNMYRLVGDWMRGTEPVVPQSIVDAGDVTIGSHQLELIEFKGHSNADLAIFDHTTGVLFSGDLVFNHRTPTTPHADLEQWLAALKQLQQLPFKVLVPGHGSVIDNGDAIDLTADYLTWLDRALTEAAEQGVSMAEALSLPIPTRFESLAVLRDEYPRSVSHLYPTLEQRALDVP